MAAMTQPNISLTIDAHQADEREVFRPHGRLCVRLDGAVVRIDAEGPFNAELFEAFGRLGPPVYREAALGGNYVVLVRAQRSVMMSMEAMADLARSVKAFQDGGFGPLASVYVTDSSVEGRELMLPLLARHVYQPANLPFTWFETEAEALAYARERLAQAGPRAAAADRSR